MKKIIQILFFLFISNYTWTQEKKDSLLLKHKWSVYVSGYGNYMFPDFFTYTPGNKLKITPGAEFGFSYSLKRKFHFRTGVSLDYFATKSIYDGPLISGAPSRTYFSNYTTANLSMILSYNFGKEDFFCSVRTGIVPGILISSKQEACDDVLGCLENDNLFKLGSFMFFFTGGLRINYKISERLTMSAGIDISYQTKPLVYITTGTSGAKYENYVYLKAIKLPVELVINL